MGLVTRVTLVLILVTPSAVAQIVPEEISVETTPDRGENWFIGKTGNGGYIFDATDGEMKGMLSLSRYTPAVTFWPPRGEFYAAESYLARGVYGERTDIVAIYDYENLSPIAEIEIPNYMARLQVRSHMGLLNNGRHLAVLNMNPGHSVSIVDVEDRIFTHEASTPGCAVIMPVAQNDFMQVCGDGTLQLIQLDISGFEANRVRSDVFFSVMDDAIFDRVASSNTGWFLITHSGTIFHASTDDDEIIIEDGWNPRLEGEENWRPGGRNEIISAHHETGLIFVAMHEGPIDTHHEPGTEIWVLDSNSKRRIGKIELDTPANSVLVTQESNPKLLIVDSEGGSHVYDAITLSYERSIEIPGSTAFEDL